MAKMKYKRILIKISGESLSDGKKKLDVKKIDEISEAIKNLLKQNVEIAIVVGAGNIWRGSFNDIFDSKIVSDYMGMTATIINALAIKEKIKEKTNNNCHVVSKISCELIEKYSRDNVMSYLKNNEVVIFACGTGNPCFTTDTAASLYAIEIDAQAIFMAKNKINAVYDKDPNKNKNAKIIKNISFQEAIDKKLKVMDLTALTLLNEHKKDIKIHVFSLKKENFVDSINGKNIGTLLHK